MMHLYIEDSAELQIYRPIRMLNKVHMHLCLYSISLNDHLPNFYRCGEGVGGEGIYYLEHPKFDLTGLRTHDLQIMTVYFMSLRRLL